MAIPLITQFFAYIQMVEKEILYAGELQNAFQINVKQEQNLLSKLVKRGSIIRLKKGIYLVPKKIPPGGKWQPDTLLLISHFMDVMKAKYYIGGLFAFHHHHLTTQIANQIVIYNNKISGKKKLGNLHIQLIKINDAKIGDFIRYQITEMREVNISSLSRTILDAFVDWDRFNTLPLAYVWIKNNLADKKLLQSLVQTTSKYGNMSSKRRIGYFLYQQTSDKKLVEPLVKNIKPTTGWTLLNPVGARSGKTNITWGIIDNVSNT